MDRRTYLSPCPCFKSGLTQCPTAVEFVFYQYRTRDFKDRLTHKAHILILNGESHRFRQSMKTPRNPPNIEINQNLVAL
jgi:hypothetical protein